MTDTFRADESFAIELDANDPLARYRDQFHIPLRRDNRGECIYLCGNSLGLQPRSTASLIQRELDDWAAMGVDGHFHGRSPWYSYHEIFRDCGARLVGAKPGEVVMMNSLTVNLHLMMVSFYRPTKDRYKILMEYPAFPSDTYAVRTHLGHHGLDPDEALVIASPRPGKHNIETETIEQLLDEQGDQIALVLLAGVNFFTGQAMDIARITTSAQEKGCVVGWDLAHAAGNIVLALHEWNVDFAVWCNYKYLNSGPGAVAGCYVHDTHGRNLELPRFAGWWGNDPSTRFRMHMEPEFIPREGADGWQISNPPIFSLAPVKASLDLFDEVGMPALREKSLRLTAYLRRLIDRLPSKRFEIITPHEANAHGCQLSMLVMDRPKELFAALQADGVICDFREPNVIRIAPVPFYNTFHDVWSFSQTLARHAGRA